MESPEPNSAVKAALPAVKTRSRAADAFVVLAMTVTAVALAIGLYLQFRLAFWLAVVAALSVYVCLLALHALVRRSERVETLSAELERLRAELEVARSHGASAQAKCKSQSAAAPPASTQIPQPLHAQVGPAAVGGNPNPNPNPNRPATAVAASSGSFATIAVSGAVSGGAQAAQGPPPVVRPAQVGGSQVGGSPSGTTPSASAGPNRESGVSARPQIPRDTGTGEPRAPDTRPTAVPPVSEPIDYWPARPQSAAAPPAVPVSAAVAGDAERHRPRSVQPPPLPQRSAPVGEPAGRNEWRGPASAADRSTPLPSAPGLPPPVEPSRTISPREADVEMIQGLIKKLADEVNAAEAGLLSKPAGSSRVPPSAIEASVNALRTTADTMRSPAAPQGGGPLLPAVTPLGVAAPPAAQDLPAGPAAPRAVQPPPRVPPQPQPPALPDSAVTQAKRPAPPLPPRNDAAAAAVRATPAAASARDPDVAAPPQPGPSWSDEAGSLVAPAPSVESAASGTAAHAKLAALAEAITAGRLDVLLDPILGLADQRARHFEVAVRLKDKNGQILDPPEGVPELRESGLLPLLDCARIGRTAQVARRLADRGRPGAVFSAFSGESLGHDQFLSDFTDAYVAREGLATQLVLSFAQGDVRGFAGRDWDTVQEMRELGFRFSLQSVTDLDIDFEALKAAGFDFVKLDASVFLDGMPASGGLVPASDICRYLAQLGMTLIVGKIDDETQLARIFGFGVIYGQGQLFGGARPMKAEASNADNHAAA